MKRFHFRLARLERLRELQRSRARGELARAIIRMQTWRREADEQQAELERRGEQDARSADETTADTLKAEAAWRHGRTRLIAHTRAQQVEAEAVTRERQREYEGCARGHRVVERLREKRLRRWQLAVELDERKFLDEVHLLRVARERGRGDRS